MTISGRELARAAGRDIEPVGTGAGGGGVGKGVKPARGLLRGPGRGPVREVEIRDTPAGESADAMNPPEGTCPSCAPRWVGGWRWQRSWVAASCATGLLGALP